MRINLEDFLNKVKLKTKKGSLWYESGLRIINFRNDLQMTHRKLGSFSYISQEDIEIDIPDDLLNNQKLINKPVEITEEQPTHLVMMYSYPHEFVNLKNIDKRKYFKGFTREEREATRFIPIKLGEIN